LYLPDISKLSQSALLELIISIDYVIKSQTNELFFKRYIKTQAKIHQRSMKLSKNYQDIFGMISIILRKT
jgi:hypothetical protein